MRTLPLLAILAAACDGGQTGEEGARCEAMSSVALEPAEQSPLGFAPSDVLSRADGTHTASLAYAIGGTSDLTVEVTPDGTAFYVTYEFVDDGSGQEPALLGCDDQVELGATVTVATADGAFDESHTARLLAAEVDDVSFYVPLDLDALGGTYEVTTEIDMSEFDEATAWIDLHFHDAFWEGVVDGQASGTTGDGPDDAAFAQGFEIASWTTATR